MAASIPVSFASREARFSSIAGRTRADSRANEHECECECECEYEDGCTRPAKCSPRSTVEAARAMEDGKGS